MTDIIIPEEITLPLFVTLGVANWNFNSIGLDEMDFRKYSSRPEEKIMILETEITLKLPQDIDAKGQILSSLEKEKAGIRVKFHMRLKRVQDKIDNLLAIEHRAGMND